MKFNKNIRMPDIILGYTKQEIPDTIISKWQWLLNTQYEMGPWSMMPRYDMNMRGIHHGYGRHGFYI